MNRKTWRFYFAGTMILLMSFFSGGLIQAQAADRFDPDRRLLWYEQPWVWVAASCLFLLLLVLALREPRKDKI
jgi:Na+/melibiose symporter-like transporter